VPLSKPAKWISIVLQITSAAILVQTLFFKFTAAPESVYIFTKVGAEPWGRIGSGVVELIAAALLLLPSRVTIGALLALGVMAGAIGSHLTVLGIEIMGDGGLLFGLAVYVFVASGVIVYLRRAELPVVGPMLVSRLAGGRR
jgi:putative oxidoreductase